MSSHPSLLKRSSSVLAKMFQCVMPGGMSPIFSTSFVLSQLIFDSLLKTLAESYFPFQAVADLLLLPSVSKLVKRPKRGNHYLHIREVYTF